MIGLFLFGAFSYLCGWAVGRWGANEEAAELADKCHAPDIAFAIRELR